MDPNWVQIVIGLVIAAASAVSAYWGTRVAVARMEERQNSLGSGISRLERLQEEQGLILGDHSGRIRVLEHAVDVRQQPNDYGRR